MSAQTSSSVGEASPARPILTVGGLLFNLMGEALFVRTHKWNNRYGLPGGKVELGETLEQAFRREVREETALEVTDIEFICVQESIFSPDFYKPLHMVLLNFQATVRAAGFGDVVPVLNDEAQEYVWMHLEAALETLDLNGPTQHLVRTIIERRPSIKGPVH